MEHIRAQGKIRTGVAVGLYLVGEEGLGAFCALVRQEWAKGNAYKIPMPMFPERREGIDIFAVYAVPAASVIPEPDFEG